MSEMYDDEDETEVIVEVPPPSWRFSLWDMVGIAAQTVSEVFEALSHAGALIAQECQAAANYQRNRIDYLDAEREAAEVRAEIGADLDALVNGDRS